MAAVVGQIAQLPTQRTGVFTDGIIPYASFDRLRTYLRPVLMTRRAHRSIIPWYA